MSAATAIKERPILFSAPMVKAILVGTKTQTRRAIKPQPSGNIVHKRTDGSSMSCFWEPGMLIVRCPYGEACDRLWVKESFRAVEDPGACREDIRRKFRDDDGETHIISVDYRVDGGNRIMDKLGKPEWKSPIFMPRWASRITLEITEVRVQRLHDITEEDAIAEGVDRVANNFGNGPAYCDYGMAHLEDTAEWFRSPIDSFRSLWESINGKGSWALNPWLWAISFRRLEAIH